MNIKVVWICLNKIIFRQNPQNPTNQPLNISSEFLKAPHKLSPKSSIKHKFKPKDWWEQYCTIYLTASRWFDRSRLLGQVDGVGNEHVVVRGVLMERGLSGLQEGDLDFDGLFGTGLEVRDGLGTLGFAPLGGFRLRNTALRLLIHLVADHNKWEIIRISWICLVQKFLSPTIQLLERFLSSDVINQDTGISTAIKSNSKTLKSLLTSGVPNLKETCKKSGDK